MSYVLLGSSSLRTQNVAAVSEPNQYAIWIARSRATLELRTSHVMQSGEGAFRVVPMASNLAVLALLIALHASNLTSCSMFT